MEKANGGSCSMVNAWSSDELPVPSIRVNLMFSSLGLGLLDFVMCSLVPPCQVLMKSPGLLKKQWCQMTVSDLKKGSAGDDRIDGSVPSIKLEAMFAPSGDGLTKSTTSNHELSEPAEPIEKEEGDLASTPNITSDEEVDSPIMLQGMAQLPMDPFQTHMLSVALFWIPAMCGVCSTVMLGRNHPSCNF
jgi:hypothetical protein